MLVEINELVAVPFSKKDIQDFFSQVVPFFPGQSPENLSVVFVGESEIRKWNKKYRKKDEATDVLSFIDPPEIMICGPILKKQARERGRGVKEELVLLLLHGFLHILGYTHEQKEEAFLMQSREKEILEKIKY
ncbi:rRNA maturation RNase YbeY [Patescibacteria group bacterium]|nr:rRNA maturation RNase YbeY [Patescibacteria group bacterium]